jgi:hypothetical protein
MIDVQSCRQYAADCVRQAQNENSADDKNILLNVALAWLRLGNQTQELSARAFDAQEQGGDDDVAAGVATHAERPELVS